MTTHGVLMSHRQMGGFVTMIVMYSIMAIKLSVNIDVMQLSVSAEVK